uniref:Uncharacterized protein n=1 Tax=Physcomitrium patens TaxID=3218 RepID=A0A2K1L6K0_PHYPA|nr:hypothetical protein PHYPA_000073 [Physcomitrium patens]
MRGNSLKLTAGWTTGSGLEGPSYLMDEAANEMWSHIFSKSSRVWLSHVMYEATA